MDRDRGRDRRGDGEVTRMGAGESYRPSARPRAGSRPRSPRPDLFSPRRERARSPPAGDSWHPGARDRSPRRRSRSPLRRDRTPPRDNWRSRPRSPPRARSPRRFSPLRRDDDRRARSPMRRDDRRRSRSPFERDRPLPRARSPVQRRSPPPAPRAPNRSVRSRSPPERREDRFNSGPNSSNRRRRTPSPPFRDSARESERTSGKTSRNTSRRSSPHAHSDRLRHGQDTAHSDRSRPISDALHSDRSRPTQETNRDVKPRSPPRERSPPTQLAYRDRADRVERVDRESAHSARTTPRERSPVRPTAPKSPPRGPSGFRAPPTGPSGGRNFTAPSLTSSRPPVTASSNRVEQTGPVVPPAGPRGYVPPARGALYGMRGGGRGSFGTDRQSRPDTASWGAAPPSRPVPEPVAKSVTPISRPTQSPSPSIPSGPSAITVPTGPAAGIPTGPRAGVPPTRPALQHSSNVYSSRTLSSQAVQPSGPRVHPAMTNLPQIIPGGRIDPSASGIPSDIALRLKRKEEEAEILREELHVKEEKLRQGLKMWDKLTRTSSEMGLRTELSERHVRVLAGEGVGGAAF